jgi:hypothetical protein
MKKLLYLFLAVTLFSCNSDSDNNDNASAQNFLEKYDDVYFKMDWNSSNIYSEFLTFKNYPNEKFFFRYVEDESALNWFWYATNIFDVSERSNYVMLFEIETNTINELKVNIYTEDLGDNIPDLNETYHFSETEINEIKLVRTQWSIGNNDVPSVFSQLTTEYSISTIDLFMNWIENKSCIDFPYSLTRCP